MTEQNNDPELTQFDIDELLKPSDVDDSFVQDVPCRIYTRESGTFNVPDVGAWYYHQLGVFATGHWIPERPSRWDPTPPVEVDALIPYDQILHMEFNFEALKRYEEQGAKTVGEPESHSD